MDEGKPAFGAANGLGAMGAMVCEAAELGIIQEHGEERSESVGGSTGMGWTEWQKTDHVKLGLREWFRIHHPSGQVEWRWRSN